MFVLAEQDGKTTDTQEEEGKKGKKNKRDSSLITTESISDVFALFSILALLILFTREAMFGDVGLYIHMLLTGLFGYGAYPLFVVIAYNCIMSFLGVKLFKKRAPLVAFTITASFATLIFHAAFTFNIPQESYLPECFNAGANFPACTVAGWIGALPVALLRLASPVGAIVILSALFLVSLYITVKLFPRKAKKTKKQDDTTEQTTQETQAQTTPQPAPQPAMQATVQPTAPQPTYAQPQVQQPYTQPQVQQPQQPMPGYYQGGFAPQNMGGYYPYGSQYAMSQRPGVSLWGDGEQAQETPQPQAGQAQGQPTAGQPQTAERVFSPFGSTGLGNPAPQQITPEESRRFLFSGSPQENFRTNLIFDSTSAANSRSGYDPSRQPVAPTYSQTYSQTVDSVGARPTKIVNEPQGATFGAQQPSFTAREQTPAYTEPTRSVTPPVQETPTFETRGRGYEQPTAFNDLSSQEAATRDETTMRQDAENSGASDYQRHEYMDVFSLSNPNIFGAQENADRSSTRKSQDEYSDRSSIFDDEETTASRSDDPYSLRSFDEPPARSQTTGRREEVAFDTTSRGDSGFDVTESRRIPVETPQETVDEVVETPPVQAVEVTPPKPRIKKPYVRIPLDYFDCSDTTPDANEDEVEHIKQMIIMTLADYKVSDATIASVTFGPTVTRYNVAIPRNVSPRKVVALEQEIAISLCCKGVNIYPSFEDGTVSIEVPNKNRQFVQLGCMFTDDGFIKAKPTSLTFAMGKDVANRKVYGDICKMTHLLVAGSSGAGKSVFLGSLIISLIVKYSPDELRLILIDPKKTEFVLYNNLPHLMINEIITDVRKAIQSLNWAIGEMNRRYSLFEKKSLSGTYVVNIDEYNANLGEGEDKLPKIVIIVDELADLMLAAKKDMEDRIQNLTQKARAAGIHLILATQRPSADVITGVIKGNLSTRIAFTVASDVDSRVILDQTGAQKLLGYGDLLYTMAGINTPVRVQSPFISSADSQKVVDFIKANNEAYYDEAATAYINNSRGGGNGDEGGDPVNGEVEEIYIQALKLVIQSGNASISMVHRKCSIGFNKAGKIIEWMEAMEYISPFEGAKARKVLITKEVFEQLYGPF